ncbi:hypothetical protein GCM10011404_08970 [Sphingomonas prati]|nr:hypothetical protein GCM10011404_08970 [Sphingomonas prati]
MPWRSLNPVTCTSIAGTADAPHPPTCDASGAAAAGAPDNSAAATNPTRPDSFDMT